MAELIVGNKDCSIAKIVDTIMSTPGCDMLFKDWHTIATALETPGLKKQKLSQDLIVNMTTVGAALESVLTEWRSRMANNATLIELINVFRKKDLLQIAESLEETFGVRRDNKNVPDVQPCSQNFTEPLPESELCNGIQPTRRKKVKHVNRAESQCCCCCV